MQRLQIQLLVGFGWNKASCRPLHGLSYRMGISEIILVPLPKRLSVEYFVCYQTPTACRLGPPLKEGDAFNLTVSRYGENVRSRLY